VFHLGRPDVTIPPRVALRRGAIVEANLLRLAATALTEVRHMGLVITRRRELKRRAKYWLLKLAIQNPPSQHIIHSLAQRDASGCTTAPQFGRICAQHSRPDLIPLAHGSHGQGKDLVVLTELVGGCGIGRAYFALQPDGRITPCVYLPDVTVGHVRQDHFLDLWHHSPLLNSLGDRVDLKGHCATREYQAVCGGCRARAYAYFGDFKGPDPGCINNAAAICGATEREQQLDPAAPAHLRQAAGGY
jgi:radical SAM protein with 4Fe4S-binding SPASM domain